MIRFLSPAKSLDWVAVGLSYSSGCHQSSLPNSYFLANSTDIRYDIGTLSMFTAAAPNGPWAETRLLGWNSRSPFSSTNVMQNISTDAGLAGVADCLLLTEPGAMIDDNGTIHLAVGCVKYISAADVPIEVRLLRSTDHGARWTSVSTLLSKEDAAAFSSTNRQFNGAGFYQKAGKTYMFASPAGEVDFGGGRLAPGYRGCLSFEVEDLNAGQLKRCNGQPVLAAAFTGEAKQFIGACSYAEGATALGIAGDVLSATPRFQIFATAP
jgi:hypothetical protein